MPQAGYVYMLHGIDTSYVKIGKTTNLIRRVQELAQGVPFSVQLLSAQLVPDMDASEHSLLQAFAAYRTRGEWFALPHDVLAQWPIAVAARIGAPEDIRATRAPRNVGARILALLESGQANTARELQLRIKHSRSKDIQKHLTALIDRGFIRAFETGRRTLFLVQPSAAEEITG